MMMRLPVATAADVARVAGVHASTVSRSLDPLKRNQVKATTRERVVRAAAELGYRPNMTASSLRRRRSNTIGVLISSFSNPIYGEMLHGISGELEPLGYHLLIAELPDDADEQRFSNLIEMMSSRRIDGLICAAARGRDTEILRSISESGLPVVLCLRWIEATGIARIVNDDALGGALAARHLLSLGHTSILEITGPTDISTFAERARGFQGVLAESSVTLVHQIASSLSPSVEEGNRAMAAVLNSGTPLSATAVFAHNDLLAVGALDALARAGFDCPDQISVVGYNDNPLTGHLNPGLTTIRLQIDRMGREAGRAVLAVMSDSAPVEPVLSLAPELIIRASTGPPRSPTVSEVETDHSSAWVEGNLPSYRA
ncbi:transcriptional regulator, LacI family [Leifsonia rubra CMS 76R]|nr:transcriptional regulator, LacI family [Leifsonia rubra CMS 76R]